MSSSILESTQIVEQERVNPKVVKMISHRFIKYVPEISQCQEQYSITSFISKMSFFCSQEGVKGAVSSVALNHFGAPVRAVHRLIL